MKSVTRSRFEKPIRCASVLSVEGFDVSVCGRGHEALTILKRRSFDIVLLDLNMTQVSGMELLEACLDTSPQTIAIILTLYLAKGVGSYLSSYVMTDVGQRVVRDLRNLLFRHILGQSAAFFSQQTSGRLLSRITNDVSQVQRAVSETLGDLLREAITLLFFVGVLARYARRVSGSERALLARLAERYLPLSSPVQGGGVIASGGSTVLRELAIAGGEILAVPDEEIAAAQGELAVECGIVAEFTSAATLAALLRRAGDLRGQRVVLVITGGRADS